MKIGLVLACFAVAATAQVTATKTQKTFKAIESAQLDVSSDGPVIRYDGREWKPDLSKVPIRTDDCETPEDKERCADQPATGCLLCAKEWAPVAWDEPRKVFYLATCTGPGQNREWIIFAFALTTGQLARIAGENGGGFDGSRTVSPSGQYLAYTSYGVCGVCSTSSRQAVVDIGARRSGFFEIPVTDGDEKVDITGLQWTGSSTLKYDARINRESACKEGVRKTVRYATGRVEAKRVVGP